MTQFTTVTFTGTAAGLPFTAIWTFDYPLHTFEPDYSPLSQTNILTDITVTYNDITSDMGSAGYILQGHQPGGTGTEIIGISPDMQVFVISQSQFFNQPFNAPYIYTNTNHAPIEGSIGNIPISVDTVTLVTVPGPIIGTGLSAVLAFALCAGLFSVRRNTTQKQPFRLPSPSIEELA